MSLCDMEFHVCCTCYVNTGMDSAGVVDDAGVVVNDVPLKTDLVISQIKCVWDSHESATAVIYEIAPQTMTPGVDPVCLGRSLVTGIPLASFGPTYTYHWHQGRTFFHQKAQQISSLSSIEL
ncbi:hypothetical protein TNCV_1436001 [Trichonephila clavipes]|nr:hypothetical protein TNCV_1436001 [Trichonephila clavipes]